MNIAVFSVVYPGVLSYLGEFLSSLSNQTCKDFRLFLANDGVRNIQDITCKADFGVIVKDLEGTPSAIRKAGIEWVKQQGQDVIIFADSDDYFKDDRIEISKEMLSCHDIIFNELVIVGEDIQQPFPMLKYRFREGEELSADDLKHSNCMGLSNTAINAKRIPALLPQIPDDIIAFDWAFFSLCLREGAPAAFTGQTATYYRQHENNIASPLSFEEDQAMRGVRVKRDHYRLISRFCDKYESMSDEFDKLSERLSTDAVLRERYCHEIKRQTPPSPLWWESIKTLEELEL